MPRASEQTRDTSGIGHLVGWFRTRQLQSLLLTLVALAAAFVVLFPLLWIVVSSFRDADNFLSMDIRDTLPKSINFVNYRAALARAGLVRWIGNSLLVALSTTALSLLLSAPAAFALARLRFRLQSPLRTFTTVIYAIPSITILVPMFVILVKLNLNNSYIGLILVHATFTVPFSIWVLQDFYRAIPADLEEAGYVDGASLIRVLVHIIAPLSVPGLLAAGVYAFILSWNEFTFAMVIMSSSDAFTAPVGIHAYFQTRGITEATWAQLMAAATTVSLPSAILFGFFQRYLVSGFLSGAVKG